MDYITIPHIDVDSVDFFPPRLLTWLEIISEPDQKPRILAKDPYKLYLANQIHSLRNVITYRYKIEITETRFLYFEQTITDSKSAEFHIIVLATKEDSPS